jgi:hypothetical protein
MGHPAICGAVSQRIDNSPEPRSCPRCRHAAWEIGTVHGRACHLQRVQAGYSSELPDYRC